MKVVYIPDHKATYNTYGIVRVYDGNGYRMLVKANGKTANPLTPEGLTHFYINNHVGAELIYTDPNLPNTSERLGHDADLYWLTFNVDWVYVDIASNTQSVSTLKQEDLL